jgi:superfamily II DNA/RNA helicase
MLPFIAKGIRSLAGPGAVSCRTSSIQGLRSGFSSTNSVTSEELEQPPVLKSPAMGIFQSGTRFGDLPLSISSQKALKEVFRFEMASEIQHATLPSALDGHDILAKARTGGGKTLAFLLPIVEKLVRSKVSGIGALIVCPTRELAQQIASEATLLLTHHNGIRAESVYGGRSIFGDVLRLTRDGRINVEILIATPGRCVVVAW